jgi:hypothetical protein
MLIKYLLMDLMMYECINKIIDYIFMYQFINNVLLNIFRSIYYYFINVLSLYYFISI